MAELNGNGVAKDDSNVVGFPLSDHGRAAADLRHLADLIEQGEIDSAAAVFCHRTDRMWTAFKWQGGDPDGSGYDATRLVGAFSIMHAELLDEVRNSDDATP